MQCLRCVRARVNRIGEKCWTCEVARCVNNSCIHYMQLAMCSKVTVLSTRASPIGFSPSFYSLSVTEHSRFAVHGIFVRKIWREKKTRDALMLCATASKNVTMNWEKKSLIADVRCAGPPISANLFINSSMHFMRWCWSHFTIHSLSIIFSYFFSFYCRCL